MRGGKNTLWEGGTRVIGVVRGPWVGAALRGTTTFAPFHAVDWLPTLVHAATGDPDWHRLAPPGEPPYLDGDGMSVLKTIHTGAAVRTELLLECHPGHAPVEHGNALIVDGWKLLQLGTVHPQEEFGWHPPPGQDAAATAYTLGCDTSKQPTNVSASECADTPCLFHVTDDPCEYVDLAASHADKVAELSARLAQLQATAVPPVEPHGCTPVVTDGAWRPCDAPDDAPGFLVQ
jgi:arylsulfatase A-like enzyme